MKFKELLSLKGAINSLNNQNERHYGLIFWVKFEKKVLRSKK